MSAYQTQFTQLLQSDDTKNVALALEMAKGNPALQTIVTEYHGIYTALYG